MSEHTYWAEEHREGEIDVVCSGNFEEALSNGKAIQFYGSHVSLKQSMKEEFPTADVWYTERNGDPIAMLVPAGTHTDLLPSVAMDYMALEWIDPDKDFGTGVMPARRNR